MNKVVKALTQSLGVLGIVILVLISFHSWTNVDAAELTYEPTYNQSEARSMLDRINEFRHSSEAWYWNVYIPTS